MKIVDGTLAKRYGMLLAILVLATSPLAAAADEMAAMPAWLSKFRDPPATWRPQIFLVANGRLNRKRTTEMLQQYKDRGIGGVFLHCRPGLITEYLSEEFFAQWDWALHECKRLGMECHIYDENAFPSGFAGGEVMAANPTLGATYLAPVKITRAAQVPDERVVAYFMGLDVGKPQRVDRGVVEIASKDNPVWAVVLTEVPADLRHGGFPYPDLLRRETTEIFLRTTHEKYAARFADDFGSAIKYVFTDEPRLPGKQGIPFSDALAGTFREEHGYDLHDKLESLLFDRPGSNCRRICLPGYTGWKSRSPAIHATEWGRISAKGCPSCMAGSTVQRPNSRARNTCSGHAA